MTHRGVAGHWHVSSESRWPEEVSTPPLPMTDEETKGIIPSAHIHVHVEKQMQIQMLAQLQRCLQPLAAR